MKLYELTLPQNAMWHIDRFYHDSCYVNIGGTALIDAEVDPVLLIKAINVFIEKNDAMRLRIAGLPEPRQYVAGYKEHDFEIMDFSYEGGPDDLHRWAVQDMKKPFDNDSDLFFFTIFKYCGGRGGFYVKLHHIISDAWGISILTHDILTIYWSLKNGDEISIERGSYLEYLENDREYRSSARFEKDHAFWREEFRTLPELTALKRGNSIAAERKTHLISGEKLDEINNFCKTQKISNFVFLFSVFSLLISRKTEKKDIVIGTPVLNRLNHKQKTIMGLFMHIIPFRIMIDDHLSFLESTRNIFSHWMRVLRAQRFPYHLILKEFRERHQTRENLFDIAFSYQNNKIDFHELPYKTEWKFNGAETSCLSVSFNDRDEEHILRIDYDYQTDVFSAADIDQIHSEFMDLMDRAMAVPEAQIAQLLMISGREREKVLFHFNDTAREYPPGSIHELFEASVAGNPQRTALVFEDRSLTYTELNRRVNQLARLLRRRGADRNTIVGLALNRSMEIIIGLLAVLKSGAAYLPIEPGFPAERTAYMLQNSGCRLVLTGRDVKLPVKDGLEAVFIDDPACFTGEDANVDCIAGPEDTGYVLYTSGSTGLPKGVMVTRRNLYNFARAIPEIIDFSGGKVIVSVTTVCFDIFFLEAVLPLLRGMTVVIANQDQQKIPALLHQLLKKHKADMIQTTPPLMQLLVEDRRSRDSLAGLSEIMIGGEQFPQHLLTTLKKISPARIFNLYGPTETTIWSSIAELTETDRITIGRPIANTQFYILDQRLNPVETGRIGEIYIGGEGVARGYINNEALTAEKFMPNPFLPGSMIYRTGDLGRWLPDGTVDCIGRNDFQVKIRGYRIELEEIENTLLKHSQVKKAVVTGKKDQAGHDYLCAYIVTEGEPRREDLRAYLAKSLPDYMLPSYYVFMENFPLTPNGKVDIKALPEPDRLKLVSGAKYAAPRNEVERILAKSWSEALGNIKIGIDDNLFSLGGDSLIIIEILSDTLSYNWGISAQDFYEYPTIRLLSARIQGAVAEKSFQPETKTPGEAKKKIPRRINKPAKKADRQTILLTGVTGLLGIHILEELLSVTNCHVICLIRGTNPKDRLLQSLGFYYPYLIKDIFKRVSIVNGDITKDNLGLSPSGLDMVSRVDAVIHCAANVKHYGDYNEFYNINVAGTERIISLCREYAIKLYHISTASVLLIDDGSPPSAGYVRDRGDAGRFSRNVYIRTKLEAEKKILASVDEGLEAVILRVGVLSGRYSDGRFQKNIEDNALYLKLKSILNMLLVPDKILSTEIDLTPVDLCAEAVVRIINAKPTGKRLYHVFNPNVLTIQQLVNILRCLGIDIKISTLKEYNMRLLNMIENRDSRKLIKGVVIDPFDEVYFQSIVHPKNNDTETVLEKQDFSWPVPGEDYIRKMLRHMENVGFIKLNHRQDQSLR